MRKIVVAALVLAAFALAGTMPARAVGTRHAFCLQGDEYPALSYCPFDTYGTVPGVGVGPQSAVHGQSLLQRPIGRPLRLPESRPPISADLCSGPAQRLSALLIHLDIRRTTRANVS